MQILNVKGRFVHSFKEASGNMDAAGTAECLHWLLANTPGEFEDAVLVEDGDGGKIRRWRPMPRLRVCKCTCHKGKNIPVCLNKNMSKIACTCKHPGSKSCVNIDGYRYKDAIGRKAAARFYKIVHDAEVQYIPELHNNEILTPECLVGTPEREARRLGAIEWAKTEVLHMALHFKGDHEGCSHGVLPDDHPAVRCKAQQAYLAQVLTSLAECMGDVLTPFGAMDINSTESLHAVLRKYRPKGEKWGAVQCFLGETLGLLHWQRLQLAFWQPGVPRNPKVELAELIQTELGIRVPFHQADIEELEKDVEVALNAKEKRLLPSYKTRRAQYKAVKLGYASRSAATSSYQGGQIGGAAAAPNAQVQAEIDYLGAQDLGGVLDPTETKGEQHASAMSTADAQAEEFGVDGDEEEGMGGGEEP